MSVVRPVMIMAGGTGGHVFPGLAVANKLKMHGVPVIWLGTKKGMESRLVPEAGFPIEWLGIAGLRGKGVTALLMAPFKLLCAMFQAATVINKHNPQSVIGMGGFASGPGGVMAWLLGKPLLIHEQNAVAGLTNKILSRFASCVMEAFPGSFPAQEKVICTGNPVREEIVLLDDPALRGIGNNERMRILVVGGSLGAKAINELMPEVLARFQNNNRPEVWHQTGEKNLQSTLLAYKEKSVAVKAEAFIKDMSAAYQWADFVICRAGALTVSELAAAGIGSILIPFPYAVDDHQTFNAQYLSNDGAAIVYQQKDLSVDLLFEKLVVLNKNRGELLAMASAARKLAKVDSVDLVTARCLQVGG